jgi:endonuclease G
LRDDGQLSATAYLLSQASFMDDLEFVFGPYRTFQVSVAALENRTTLSFADLRNADPFGSREGPRAISEIRRFDELLF